jgi:hypothetical protein
MRDLGMQRQMITKEAATALLLESYRQYKRNCPRSYKLIGPRGRYFFVKAKGWCLLPATMEVVRAPYIGVTKTSVSVHAVK